MLGFHAHGLNGSYPIYVTRKTAGGETMSYSLSLWMTLLVILLVWANVIVWAGYGLYEFGRLCF